MDPGARILIGFIVACAATACLMVAFGCSSIRAAADPFMSHGVQVGLGAAIALGLGLLLGLALWPAAAVGAAGATTAVLATPPCPPQTVTNINGPGAHVTVRGALGQEAYGMPIWFWFAFGFVLAIAVRNRHWLPFWFSKQAKGYRLRLLLHFVLGGRPPVIPPQFIPEP